VKLRLAAVLVALIAALAVPAVARATFASTFRHALLARINNYRAAYGRRPLVLNLSLRDSAIAHSSDMARHTMLSHTASTGCTWIQRIRYWGYRGTYIGENLAAGTFTPLGVMHAWRASPDHRANLLGLRYRVIGLGVARGTWGGHAAVYVTVDFGGS
jgi:uncharacterized protein YkwD